MPETPIRDSLKDLERLPRDEVVIGVVAEQDGDTGAMIDAQKDIGKPGGWTLAAAGRWMKDAGWSAAGLLRWRKR